MTPAPFASDKAAPSAAATSGAGATGATSVGPATTQPSNVFPALHLVPLNDTFVPKQISLSPPGVRVKIGRQTNAKTIPNGSNGYFDSKVLSRMHAEVWSEDGKVLIQDVKSSNGTFIDGQRLSPEAAESDVFELRTGSTVEFGIDIVSDDSKTVVHHKVAARVIVVMNPEDALYSSREFNAWYRQAGEQANQRRSARPLSSGTQHNGLSFDHVLSRLQGELQKSRDTASNLGDLSSALTDVHDTLGGAPAPPNFHQRNLPHYMSNGHGAPDDQHAQNIAALQSQLNDTQSSLASHVGKIRELEGLLAEQDTIKREVGLLRTQMEEAKRDMDQMMRSRRTSDEGADGTGARESTDGRESPVAKMLEAQEDEDDDDDARSVSSVDTISPANAASFAQTNGTAVIDSASTLFDVGKRGLDREHQLREQNAALSMRLDALSTELDNATKLGQTLMSQHAEAISTIKTLEERVHGLERAVEGRVAEVEGRVLREVEGKWASWRDKFEESVKQERETWKEERAKLLRAVQEWEQGRTSESDPDSSDDVDQQDASIGAASSVGQSKRRSRSKRRRRTTAVPSRKGSGLADLAGDASGDESTIEISRAGSGTSSKQRPGSRPGSSRDGGTAQGTIPLQYASAGAVVVLGVVAAWALTHKIKE